jgi:hypothetical protein
MKLYYDGVRLGTELSERYTDCRRHFLEFRQMAIDRLRDPGSPIAVESRAFDEADDFFVLKTIGLVLRFRFRLHWPYQQPIASGLLEVHEMLDGEEPRLVGEIHFDRHGVVAGEVSGTKDVTRFGVSAFSLVLSAFRAAAVNSSPPAAG